MLLAERPGHGYDPVERLAAYGFDRREGAPARPLPQPPPYVEPRDHGSWRSR